MDHQYHQPVAANRTTGFFGCRRERQGRITGARVNPIKHGSKLYADKHGLPDSRYPTNDPMYRKPPVKRLY